MIFQIMFDLSLIYTHYYNITNRILAYRLMFVTSYQNLNNSLIFSHKILNDNL